MLLCVQVEVLPYVVYYANDLVFKCTTLTSIADPVVHWDEISLVDDAKHRVLMRNFLFIKLEKFITDG